MLAMGFVAGFLTWLFFYSTQSPFGSKTNTYKFFKLLDKQFKMGRIKNKTCVITLAESFSREKTETYNFIHLLEDYLRYLVESDDSETRYDEEKYNIIKKILDEENEKKPFAEVPVEERRILQVLKKRIGGDIGVDDLLLDLGGMIISRNSENIKLIRINKWSVRFAVLGLIATILFGLLNTEIARNIIEQLISNFFIKDNLG